ncbi:MAG: DUF1080 domain-containing protein [Cyanobacteria bacterium]|nr:DUF1080 domain-containing protein [Cyanobacteriota bacterium]
MYRQLTIALSIVLSFSGCTRKEVKPVDCILSIKEIAEGAEVKESDLVKGKIGSDRLPPDAIKTRGEVTDAIARFGIQKGKAVARSDLAPRSTKVFGDWEQLFDGKTLNGWIQRNGTATYRVDGDAIIGCSAEGSPNSFLCSKGEFDNFELQLDVKLDPKLNSGIQIRSQSLNNEPTGRVNGPQVEVQDPEAGGMAGYVYGEAAGGWMSPTDSPRHRFFKSKGWNHYRIIADGARIMTWLNDQPIEDLTDQAKFESHPRGFIGLQVHGVANGTGPFEVSFKNIRLRRINFAPPAGPEPQD